MNVITIMNRFPDQKSCIAYLETIRWGDKPHCPRQGCQSDRVAQKTIRGKTGEWNCHQCKSTFNVLTGTMFQGTRVELQKWFLAISLIANAKKSLSSHQLARDLDLTQTTALYMQQRIRAEMGRNTPSALLQGIIEADECYIGGKPRKRNKRKDDEPPNKRGRGTKKTPVIGAVERGGEVMARVATDLSGRGILKFITRELVKTEESKLITDEYSPYKAIRSRMPHEVINHSERYVDGDIHTNTIEGFWSLLKRAWYGTHHHYKFTPLYVIEACWKYNHRKTKNSFDVFLKGCFA
jgi:transposase-like protein